MSSRPNSGQKTTTGHRRSESSGASGHHHRHSSSSSGHHRSDSGQSINSDHRHHLLGHYRSKSGVHEREKTNSNASDERKRIRINYTLSVNLNIILVLARVESRSLQNERHQRPTSLYPLRSTNSSSLAFPDALHPEREPINFDVALIGAPPEVEQLVNNIKQVAEQFLYHWKTFPISIGLEIIADILKNIIFESFCSTTKSCISI